jgi:DNA-binding response OmpR family regulator
MYIGLLEDEPQLAQHVCEILEGAGHAVSVFTNGADMVKAIGRDTIDLFVLDWRVPRMSGIEVLKHIREVRGLKEPVVFLMPATRPNNADRCTPNTLEDCLCETQEPRPIEGLAICYQPNKTAGTTTAKGRRS